MSPSCVAGAEGTARGYGNVQGFSELAGGHLIFSFFGSSRWVWPPVGVSLNIMIKLAASGDMKGDLNSLPRN